MVKLSLSLSLPPWSSWSGGFCSGDTWAGLMPYSTGLVPKSRYSNNPLNPPRQ